jgi:hypothetical protein
MTKEGSSPRWTVVGREGRGGEKSIENVVVDLQMQRHSAFLRDLYRVAASNSKD